MATNSLIFIGERWDSRSSQAATHGLKSDCCLLLLIIKTRSAEAGANVAFPRFSALSAYCPKATTAWSIVVSVSRSCWGIALLERWSPRDCIGLWDGRRRDMVSSLSLTSFLLLSPYLDLLIFLSSCTVVNIVGYRDNRSRGCKTAQQLCRFSAIAKTEW